MTTFQEREQAFEAKFAHDEEFRFLVTARRDKLFAQWTAERLQVSGQARLDLTASILALRDGTGHDELLRRHVAKVFSEQGSSVQEAEIAAALNQCASRAEQQLLEGSPRAQAIL